MKRESIGLISKVGNGLSYGLRAERVSCQKSVLSKEPLIDLLFLSPALLPLGVSGASVESDGEDGGAAADVSTPCRLFMCFAKFVVLPAYLIATRHCLHITCVLSSFPSLLKNPK